MHLSWKSVTAQRFKSPLWIRRFQIKKWFFLYIKTVYFLNKSFKWISNFYSKPFNCYTVCLTLNADSSLHRIYGMYVVNNYINLGDYVKLEETINVLITHTIVWYNTFYVYNIPTRRIIPTMKLMYSNGDKYCTFTRISF